ncbi:hypothetical protein ABVT39_015621, partial [Epinephelus coioides]
KEECCAQSSSCASDLTHRKTIIHQQQVQIRNDFKHFKIDEQIITAPFHMRYTTEIWN